MESHINRQHNRFGTFFYWDNELSTVVYAFVVAQRLNDEAMTISGCSPCCCCDRIFSLRQFQTDVYIGADKHFSGIFSKTIGLLMQSARIEYQG